MRKKPVRNPRTLDQPPHQDAIVANETLVRRALLVTAILSGGEPNMFLRIEAEGALCSHFERGGDQKKQKETENHMMTFNADHNLMQYD